MELERRYSKGLHIHVLVIPAEKGERPMYDMDKAINELEPYIIFLVPK